MASVGGCSGASISLWRRWGCSQAPVCPCLPSPGAFTSCLQPRTRCQLPGPSALVQQQHGRAALQLPLVLPCLAHLQTHNPSCSWPISTSMEVPNAWSWALPAAHLLCSWLGQWGGPWLSPCPVLLGRIHKKAHIPLRASDICSALNTWSTFLWDNWEEGESKLKILWLYSWIVRIFHVQVLVVPRQLVLFQTS